MSFIYIKCDEPGGYILGVAGLYLFGKNRSGHQSIIKLLIFMKNLPSLLRTEYLGFCTATISIPKNNNMIKRFAKVLKEKQRYHAQILLVRAVSSNHNVYCEQQHKTQVLRSTVLIKKCILHIK